MMDKRRQRQKDILINYLLEIAPHAEVLHHVPGEIELRIALSALMSSPDINFNTLMDAIPGVMGARLKWLSRSVVISYDPELIHKDVWDALLQWNGEDKEKPKVIALIDTLLTDRSPS